LTVLDIAPTKTAYLELLEERQSMQEGYRFLDEKRLALAAEIIRELARYEELQDSFQQLYYQALIALREATARHGLEGLQLYPPLEPVGSGLQRSRRMLLGVPLVEDRLAPGELESTDALNPSPEGRACQERFAELLPVIAELAALTGNLSRLDKAYRQTSRRARALEDVLIPEVDGTLRELDENLEEAGREEAVRVQWYSSGRRSSS
jgi:V/A-type H+-transporting ATPase subunit D